MVYREHAVSCLLLAGLTLLCHVQAESQDAQFLAGLRERQLYQLAQEHATELWQRDDLSDRQRAELAIQLALIYTEQALAAPPELRDALWVKADTACAALIDGWPDNARRPLVDVQRALVSLARGGQAREEVDGAARALEHLRDATHRLSDAADRAGRELVDLQLSPRADRSPDALSAHELESLEANISFHLARAQRQVGLCYPTGSADRDDAVPQAVKRLSPLAARALPDDVVWNARVELVACQRDLGRTDAARKLIAVWLEENPPREIAARLTADAKPPNTLAKGHADEQSSDQGFTEAMAAAAKERAAERFAAAAERYRRLALHNSSHPRAAEAHRLAILCTADLLRASEPTDYATLAASYEALLNEHLAHWPAQASADDARLWLAQLLTVRRDWRAAIEVLQQVRPSAKFFAQSVKLLVHCYENLLRDLDGNLNQQIKQQRHDVLAAATHYLQPIITGPENRWPDAWSALQRQTAVDLARLHISISEQPPNYAERLLTAALREPPANNAAERDQHWELTARSLLIAAMVRSGKAVEAHALIDQVAAAPANSLLELLAGIDEQLKDSPASNSQRQRDVGQLALAIARLLDARRTELAASTLPRLAMYRAAAVAAVGDRAAALAQYAALVAESPDDAEVHERYATLLAASDSLPELRQSLAQWQTVEARSRRGGPRWRRARQARIELLARLGDKEEAEKLVRLTRLLYPDWDTTAQ